MESASLVKAHNHARAAAVATRQSSDSTVAITEHTHAAGEFANAATNTTSLEALRTLKLLEEHHKKLAEILKLPIEQTSQSSEGDGEGESDVSEKQATDGETGGLLEKRSTKTGVAGTHGGKGTQLPSLGQQHRFSSRGLSSSIANNLASARGIRSNSRGQPLSPSVSTDQAPGNLDPHPRRDGGSKGKMQDLMEGKPTWVPPSNASTKKEGNGKTAASPRTDSNVAPVEDSGYTRFYNSFGSLINRMSAPLAFAGLPLIQEESSLSEQVTSPDLSLSKRNRSRNRATTSATADPDLTQIYSKATLRALARDGHGASDSFYVVPASGHTVSYANILNYAEKEKRRLEASTFSSIGGSVEEEDEDFVDARETPVPLSPGAKRRVGKARTERDLSNTIEELHMENKSLKDMLDKLTKRLHAFEASAQNPALALAESYRFMRPGSPMSATGASLTGGPSKVGGGDDGTSASAAAKKRVQEAEEELAAAVKQMEKMERDNRKMQKTLDKYREKWEVLKAGAKARREAQGGGDGAD